MDDLGIPSYGDIDESPEAFFRLFGDGQTELVQPEGAGLTIEHPGAGEPGTFVQVRIPGIDITAHADPRRLENLVESRDRGGFGLGEYRGRGCEQRRDGRSE